MPPARANAMVILHTPLDARPVAPGRWSAGSTCWSMPEGIDPCYDEVLQQVLVNLATA